MSNSNSNSNNIKAPWPVRKGIFRSSGQSDFVPQRTPSPIVEMPNTPVSQQTNSNPLSPLCVVGIVENPLSSTKEQQSTHQNFATTNQQRHISPSKQTASNPAPKGPTSKSKAKIKLTPINVSIREIPIEVQQEVSNNQTIKKK